MANEMFTQLPAVTNSTVADIFCAVQSGVSVQMTLGQVLSLTTANIILNYPGNPNGHVAGTTFQLCWDTTDNIMFVCTSTGSTTTTVWKPTIGQLTNGQMLIGSTGTTPVASTLTAGTNISISNGPGSITVNATGLAGIGWTNITGATQAMVADTGYVADRGSLVTFTLPTSASFGTVLYVQGFGSGGWKIAQNASQQIFIGSSGSTVGATGYIQSSNQYDSIALLCVTADLVWTALSGPQGNITVF